MSGYVLVRCPDREVTSSNPGRAMTFSPHSLLPPPSFPSLPISHQSGGDGYSVKFFGEGVEQGDEEEQEEGGEKRPVLYRPYTIAGNVAENSYIYICTVAEKTTKTKHDAPGKKKNRSKFHYYEE